MQWRERDCPGLSELAGRIQWVQIPTGEGLATRRNRVSATSRVTGAWMRRQGVDGGVRASPKRYHRSGCRDGLVVEGNTSRPLRQATAGAVGVYGIGTRTRRFGCNLGRPRCGLEQPSHSAFALTDPSVRLSRHSGSSSGCPKAWRQGKQRVSDPRLRQGEAGFQGREARPRQTPLASASENAIPTPVVSENSAQAQIARWWYRNSPHNRSRQRTWVPRRGRVSGVINSLSSP